MRDGLSPRGVLLPARQPASGQVRVGHASSVALQNENKLSTAIVAGELPYKEKRTSLIVRIMVLIMNCIWLKGLPPMHSSANVKYYTK